MKRSSNVLANRSGTAAAFTLIELLVVMAVLAVLLGILVPIIKSANRHALTNATLTQLRSLSIALSQYQADFNVYPSSTTPAYTKADNSTFPFPGIIPAGRAPCLLAEALTGYLPYDVDGCGPTLYSVTPPYPASPQKDDPQYGFRDRPGGSGRIRGPYTATDPKNYRTNTAYDQCFIDSFSNEILYYRVSTNVNPTKVFFDLTPSATSPNTNAYFDSRDNTLPAYVATKGPQKGSLGFFKTLGLSPRPPSDLTPNILSFIPPTNLPTNLMGKDSYLLISAGPMGVYFDDDDIVATKP